MAKEAEAHVHLAQQVAQAMTDFEFVQTVEAATAGVAVPLNPVELKAGLLCGFARAFRRLADYERQQVPKALRYLGRTWPEYRRSVERLSQQVGNESDAVCSDFAEALIEATQRSDTPMSAMLEFATLVRMNDVIGAEGDGMDLEAADRLHGFHGQQERPAAQPALH